MPKGTKTTHMKKVETELTEKELVEKVMVRIKTFEDALKETGRPEVPDFSNLPEDLRDYFKAQYKAAVIAEALNEGTKMDWTNSDQRKWLPWFSMSSGGFVFHDADYYFSFAAAGYGSRLCFKSEELAEYAGKQFLDIYAAILQK